MSRSRIKVDGSLEYYLQTGVRPTMPRAKNKILPLIEPYGTVCHKKQETPPRPAPGWGFLHYRSYPSRQEKVSPRPIPY